MRRFLSVVIFSFLTCSAYSAGYTCDSIKQYTSCSSGYYMTYNGSYNGTARAGNKCTACGSGCTCAGGTANQVCCTNTCTSTNNTSSTQSCTYTKSISYGTQNWSGSQTCNGKYTGGNNCTGSCTGCSSWGTCSGGSISSVKCNAGYYKNASNTCTLCEAGYYCPGGTYSASSSIAGRNTCTNSKSANASYYSTGVSSSTCPIRCNANYYGNGSTCTACNVAFTTSQSCSYTSSITGGVLSYSNGTQSRTCYHTTSSAGSTSSSSCTGTANCSAYGSCSGGTLSTVTCSAGHYKNTSNTCTTCPAGKYCAGGTFSPSASNQGITGSCNAGTYSTGGASAATCTACPAASSNSKVYVYSEKTIVTSLAGATASTQCYLDRSIDNFWVYESDRYNGFWRVSSSTGKCYYETTGARYDNCNGTRYFSEARAGYFLDSSGTTTAVSGAAGNFTNRITGCANGSYTTSVGTAAGSFAVPYTYATSCTACGAGKTNSGTANTSCSADCAAITGRATWAAPAWSNNSVSNLCKAASCNANYYLTSGSCTACGTDYPYADAGSTSVNSCYKNSTKYGGRNDAALPTGCAVQTQNECTLNSCIYRTYSNGTTSSCTVSNCNNTHKACTSASTNYYLASGVAKTCSSYSTSYPSSDGGNITSSSCYGTFSKSGNQVEPAAPAVPSGCATRTYSTSACTPGTCNYTKYASGTIKTDCTPANCTKTATITGVTAGTNHYVSGITCPACPTAYPSSDGGSISDANCYVLKTNTGTINRANASCVTDSCTYNTCSCTPGTCTWRDYYSAADTTCTPDNCSCTNSVKSWTGNPGYYFNGSSMAKCDAGNYCAGFTVTSAPTNGVGQTVCGTNTYSDAGAITCTACDTAHGYGNSGSTAANHNSVASCRVTCAGGQYVASASAGCVNVGAGYWGAGGTVAQNATLARTACASGLTTIGYGRGADEAADCGRILHAGDRQIYLRSDKKTTPSLNVKIDDAVYYGNMTAGALDGYLIIKDGDVTYRVHDDSN